MFEVIDSSRVVNMAVDYKKKLSEIEDNDVIVM